MHDTRLTEEEVDEIIKGAKVDSENKIDYLELLQTTLG